MVLLRVQKWLASRGIASRRKADSWILAGRLVINGKVVCPGDRMPQPPHIIVLDGRQIHGLKKPKNVYGMVYKPSGVVVSWKAQGERKTLYNLPEVRKFCEPFPSGFVPYVGRLDAMSEGLMLLTSDGELAQRYSHPSYEVRKVYLVSFDQALTSHQTRSLKKGVWLDDGPSGPSELSKVAPPSRWQAVRQDPLEAMFPHTGLHWYRITLGDGRNRFLRRLFRAVGARVVRLIRVQKGPILLPKDLGSGGLLTLRREDFHPH